MLRVRRRISLLLRGAFWVTLTLSAFFPLSRGTGEQLVSYIDELTTRLHAGCSAAYDLSSPLFSYVRSTFASPAPLTPSPGPKADPTVTESSPSAPSSVSGHDRIVSESAVAPEVAKEPSVPEVAKEPSVPDVGTMAGGVKSKGTSASPDSPDIVA